MLRLVLAIGLCVPLLAACETSDWMADPDDSYSSTYVSANEAPDPLSYEAMHAHNQQVNAANCERASMGADIACYDD